MKRWCVLARASAVFKRPARRPVALSSSPARALVRARARIFPRPSPLTCPADPASPQKKRIVQKAQALENKLHAPPAGADHGNH